MGKTFHMFIPCRNRPENIFSAPLFFENISNFYLVIEHLLKERGLKAGIEIKVFSDSVWDNINILPGPKETLRESIKLLESNMWRNIDSIVYFKILPDYSNEPILDKLHPSKDKSCTEPEKIANIDNIIQSICETASHFLQIFLDLSRPGAYDLSYSYIFKSFPKQVHERYRLPILNVQ